jgi:hypothetical protein
MAVKEIAFGDESADEIVAIQREVLLLRSLKHEHIVKYIGCEYDELRQTLYIFTVRCVCQGVIHVSFLLYSIQNTRQRKTHTSCVDHPSWLCLDMIFDTNVFRFSRCCCVYV